MAGEPNILVVGSINMDLVVRSPRLPAPGETVLGESLVTNPGGKGANQAVAAARLGANVRMVGMVGDDAFGQCLLENLRNEGVQTAHVPVREGMASGVAVILVNSKGENSIVVAPGANHHVCPDDIFPLEEEFAWADVVLLQLEIPLPTVRAAIDVARRHDCRIVLDPAPAPTSLPDALCRVDIFSPNVSEAEVLTDRQTDYDERIEKTVAMDLIARGAKTAVLKLGSRGSMVVTDDGHFYRVPAYKVPVVDTTAAGDAFTAALAVAVARDTHIHEAARYANAAGALACSRLGAQSAMPTHDEVRILMADQAV